MLQEQSRLFQRCLFAADFLLVALAWVIAYYVRFEFLTPPEWHPLGKYLAFLPWVLLVSSAVFWSSGLYDTNRAQRLPLLVFAVAKSVVIGLVVLAASLSFYRALYFSRLHMVCFGVLTPILMVGLRVVVYAWVRRARQQGRFLRRVLIVGAGTAGRRLERSFRQYPWMGVEVLGFLDDRKQGPDILGTVDDVTAVADGLEAAGTKVDYVYLALPLAAADRIERVAAAFSTRLTHVCMVPDLFGLDILNARVTDIGGLPVIHLVDEAPLEFRRLAKRALDIVFASAFLLVASPLLAVVAVAVKLSSPGPVFYRQERMSLNGQRFMMLKFRSMPVNAEAKSGAVWAKPGEQRATRVGALLRRTSLDELPQFINVLRGDMSVVGPRPERPVFIEEFKHHVPRYMLRHKVRAGITGWAQVHGWRGDTSIEKRIEYDLYYIQNWSLWLDVKIMWLTLWKGFVHENAY